MSDEPRDPTVPPEPTPLDPPAAAPDPPPALADGPPPPPVPPAGDGPPPGSRPRGRRVLIAVVAAAVVVLGAGAATAFFLMRGSSEQLVGLVPAEADVFATVYLDPSAGQKMNLLALAQQFPDLGDEEDVTRQVDELLDEAMSDSGLTHQDVTPWLGSQLGVSVELAEDGTPHAAALIATTDPGASRDAIEKAADGQDLRLSDYDGVEIAVSAGGEGAYAILDEAVVLATDETTVKRAIDAAHGTLPNLGDAQTYTDTLAGLPDGKLGVAYVNVAGLVDRFGSQTAASAALGAGGLGELETIESIGMSLSAEPDGIALDLTTNYDTEKLTSEQRDVLTAPDHENVTMSFVPADAFAVIGAEHTDVGLLSALDMFEQQTPDSAEVIDQAGIREFIAAMTGDIALEVGPGTDGPVSAAFLVGTDDAGEMQTFLDGLGMLASQGLAANTFEASASEDLAAQMQACQGTSRQIARCQRETLNEFYSGTGGPGAGAQTEPTPPSTEEYEGVTISFLEEPSLAEVGVTPAWAVLDGAAVIASSPEEIRQLIDTKASGEDVRTASVYASATATVPTVESVFFLDIQAIAGTVRQNLPPEAQAAYDEDVAPNIAPLSAFVVGGESDERRQTIRMFLQIGSTKE